MDEVIVIVAAATAEIPPRRINEQISSTVVELEDEADRLVTEGGRRLAIKFRYILPIDLDNSRGGLVEGADDIEQGALARTRWADDRGALADIEFEVDVLEDPNRLSPGRAVEGFGNFGELEDGHID